MSIDSQGLEANAHHTFPLFICKNLKTMYYFLPPHDYELVCVRMLDKIPWKHFGAGGWIIRKFEKYQGVSTVYIFFALYLHLLAPLLFFLNHL